MGYPTIAYTNLRRPVYGLRQAPREWHDTLRTTIVALGFAPTTADPSLFLRTDTSRPPFYVLVYVDDLVFATADREALALVKAQLQERHTCTDLGELHSYLGLEITRDRARRTITLTQSHMVHQYIWHGARAWRTGFIGSHWTLRRFLGRRPGDSTCEAKIYAGAMAAQELRWLTYLLADLGERPRSPPVLYVDNKAMLALCHEQRLEHRTKHIALRYFLARELQQRGQLCVSFVASRANTADVFTKALGSERSATGAIEADIISEHMEQLIADGEASGIDQCCSGSGSGSGSGASEGKVVPGFTVDSAFREVLSSSPMDVDVDVDVDVDADVDVDVDGTDMDASGKEKLITNSTCDCIEGCTGGDTIEFQVTFRGQRFPLRMHPRSPLLGLSACLCAKFEVDPATLKLMVRARAHSSPLRHHNHGTATTGTGSATVATASAAKSQATPSLLRLSEPSVRHRALSDAGIAHGSQVNLLASTIADVAAMSALQAGPQAAATQRVIGFEEEIERAIRRGAADVSGGSDYGGKERVALPTGRYTFHEFRTWQLPGSEMRPPVSEALALLHRLAADPGIVAVMHKHRWSVRLLSELPPEGLVGVSPVCLLGFNKNRGEEVCLRLRTDDLKGFRKYLAIRRTLIHELAHMEVDDHNAQFKALDSQLSKEVEASDWTRSASHSTAASSSLSHLLSNPPPSSLHSHGTTAAPRTLLPVAPAAPAAAAAAAAAEARAQAALAAAVAARRGGEAGAPAEAAAAAADSLKGRPQSSAAAAAAAVGGTRDGKKSRESAQERTREASQSGDTGRHSGCMAADDSHAMQESDAAGHAGSNLLLQPLVQGDGTDGSSREAGSELGSKDGGGIEDCGAGGGGNVGTTLGTARTEAADIGGAAAGPETAAAAGVAAAAAETEASALASGKGSSGEEGMDMAAAIGEEVAHVHEASHEASHRLVALREQLWQEVRDVEEFRTVLATLSRIVNNARQHPHDTKYHRIRPANPKFHSSAGRFT
ncbi:unnamed protein product, partial [Closterium sp. NIES-53]